MKNGILAVNKPKNISSAAAVSRVKKILGAEKAGHTGTLDPFATGLLLCGINKGTRISKFFLENHKKYKALIHLGIETDTYDLTGKTVKKADKKILDSINTEDIRNTVEGFRGVQRQIPPSFSALKHKGQPLYRLARKGKKIQKPPRRIEIFDIGISKTNLPFFFEIRVFCSSGTYIRAIAHDIGKKLGCGAHLASLCRTGIGTFRLKDAVDLDELEIIGRKNAEKYITPLSDCLDFMPKITAGRKLRQKIKYGRTLLLDEIVGKSEKSDKIRILDEFNNLLAIVKLGPDRYDYCCVFCQLTAIYYSEGILTWVRFLFSEWNIGLGIIRRCFSIPLSIFQTKGVIKWSY